MPRKARTSPRKHASQERSRATVDALIEATARILVREGFDRASTTNIAETAGVSVGSLYQYYPCKEALVAAVLDRHQRQLMAVVHDAFAELDGASVEAAVRRLVAAAIDGHRLDAELHRVLAEHTPRTGRLAQVARFNGESHALVRAYLEGRRNELRTSDVGLAAFLTVATVEAVTHAAVLDHPEILADDKVESLVDEVTRLVVGCLQ
jgi:AcrR family transcriptional regulator